MLKSQSWADAHVDEEEYHDEPIQPQRRESERSVEEVPEIELPTKAPFKAFIGNLPFETLEQDIIDFVYPAGVLEVNMITHRDTGKFKGFAYITFDTLESLKNALTKNGTECLARTVKVTVAEERDATRRPRKNNYERRGGGGGGRGGRGRGGYQDARGGGGGGGRGYYRDDQHSQHHQNNYQHNNNNNSNNNNNHHHNNNHHNSSSQQQQQQRPTNPDINPDAQVPDKERPRLQLKPRSAPKVDQIADPNALASSAAANKPNPFGAARPRELVLAEREKSPDMKPQASPASPALKGIGGAAGGGGGGGGRTRYTNSNNNRGGPRKKKEVVKDKDDFVRVEGKGKRGGGGGGGDRKPAPAPAAAAAPAPASKNNDSNNKKKNNKKNDNKNKGNEVVAVNAFSALMLDEEDDE